MCTTITLTKVGKYYHHHDSSTIITTVNNYHTITHAALPSTVNFSIMIISYTASYILHADGSK